MDFKTICMFIIIGVLLWFGVMYDTSEPHIDSISKVTECVSINNGPIQCVTNVATNVASNVATNVSSNIPVDINYDSDWTHLTNVDKLLESFKGL